MKRTVTERVLALLMIFIIIGFIFTELVKVRIAANAWNQYQADFEWVKSKTSQI